MHLAASKRWDQAQLAFGVYGMSGAKMSACNMALNLTPGFDSEPVLTVSSEHLGRNGAIRAQSTDMLLCVGKKVLPCQVLLS